MRDRIILACETLGISEDYLCTVTGFDLLDLSVIDFLILCEVLCISVDDVAYGYWKNGHVTRIGKAIHSGDFVLPLTPQTREIWNSYLKARKEVSVSQEGAFLLKRLLAKRTRFDPNSPDLNRLHLERTILPRLYASFGLPKLKRKDWETELNSSPL